jgi:hypothetical protein
MLARSQFAVEMRFLLAAVLLRQLSRLGPPTIRGALETPFPLAVE